MAEAAKAAAAAAQAVDQASLLDRIVEEGRFTHNEAARERGKDLVKTFVQEVLQRAATVPKDAETAINARIAQIDKLVSAQLNEVMHHPDFQKLEGAWRGLHYLVNNTESLVQAIANKDAAATKKNSDAVQAGLKTLTALEAALPADYEVKTYAHLQKGYDAAMKSLKG